MAKPKSALEELLAAASAPCTVETLHIGGCIPCYAKEQLEALAPDMAREGIAMAEAIQHGSLADQLDAMDDWLKLGEAEEGHRG